jgi:IMP dehydrogenase
MRDCISFDDVLLVPKYSDVTTRKDISLDCTLAPSKPGELNFNIPVISSPMDTVTESAMVVAMHEAGGFGIIHRYNSIEEQAFLVHESRYCNVGAAVGVSGDFVERACEVYDAGARVICIDIAHGHHSLMRNALFELRDIFGDGVHLMAGNVATLEGYEDLVNWGANSVRVGIGGGSICSTRIQTGHGIPTLQSVLDCSVSEFAGDIPIIADGGIKNSGDIVKALAAGADFVMLGSILAGASESPGEVIHSGGHQYKVYRGMASKDAQLNWRGHTASVEGVSSTVPLKGAVGDILKDLSVNIRSGLSYSGSFNINQLQSKSEFIKQSYAGAAESSTHILSKS